MAINALSANTEMLKKEAALYDASIQMYYARGINKVLSMPAMPQYYLISPDKQIVYKHTGEIKNYSEILNAIKNYKPK